MPLDTSYCCCLLFKTFQNFTDKEYSDPNIFLDADPYPWSYDMRIRNTIFI